MKDKQAREDIKNFRTMILRFTNDLLKIPENYGLLTTKIIGNSILFESMNVKEELQRLETKIDTLIATLNMEIIKIPEKPETIEIRKIKKAK